MEDKIVDSAVTSESIAEQANDNDAGVGSDSANIISDEKAPISRKSSAKSMVMSLSPRKSTTVSTHQAPRASTRKYMVKLNRNNTNFLVQLFEHFRRTRWDTEYSFLKYYQNIVRSFINDVDIDARGLLVQHQMGMGKSILAISIVIDQIGERQPIVLLTKSLQANMRGSVHKYVAMRAKVDPGFYLAALGTAGLDAWIDKNMSFVSMNASNMMKQMNRAAEGTSAEEFNEALERKFGELLKLSSLDDKLLIVDEAHNLFRAITNGSKNAIGLYDMIMRAKNLKILFLTGTPITNDAFEVVPCFNMLGSAIGKPILPESYRDFNKLFIGADGKIKNKELFQNRIFGLVSYVNHASEPGRAYGIIADKARPEFPTELPTIIEYVHMDPDQYVMYQLARDKEKEEGGGGRGFGKAGIRPDPPAMTKPKGKQSTTYRVKSRQLSNFCPPRGLENEKDPKKIPIEALGSAKHRAMYKNILKHPNQLGLVYSQFVGVGGSGTFAEYLKSKGWKELVIGASGAGEEDTADYVHLAAVVPDIPTRRGVSECQDPRMYPMHHDGAAMPSVEALMKSIEKSSNMDDWWIRGADSREPARHETGWHDQRNWDLLQEVVGTHDSGREDALDTLFTTSAAGSDETSLTALMVPGGEEPEALPHRDKTRSIVTFRYATPGDADALRTLDTEYVFDNNDMKAPNYTHLVFIDGVLHGYMISRITEDPNRASDTHNPNDPGSWMHPEVVVSHAYLADVSAVDRDELMQCIKTAPHPCSFQRPITGGVVDPAGASFAVRPDRDYYFATYSGAVSIEDRDQLQRVFNQDANKHGGILDLILTSSTGAEGLDLKNGRHVHAEEPYWNNSRFRQVISRFVRNNSHIALPAEEKNVQPYIYLAIPPESERIVGTASPTSAGAIPNALSGETGITDIASAYPPTTDTELYNDAIIGQITIDSFNEAMREVSIECLANAEPNCRACNPTNQQLYSNDIMRDAHLSNPCAEHKTAQVTAESVVVDGKTYYFTVDATNIYGYQIYVLDESVDGYRPMKVSNPKYESIVEAIVASRESRDS